MRADADAEMKTQKESKMLVKGVEGKKEKKIKQMF